MIEFTKDLFIETIDALQKQKIHDDTVCESLSTHFNCDIPEYKNHLITNQLLKILQIIFNDEKHDS